MSSNSFEYTGWKIVCLLIYLLLRGIFFLWISALCCSQFQSNFSRSSVTFWRSIDTGIETSIFYSMNRQILSNTVDGSASKCTFPWTQTKYWTDIHELGHKTCNRIFFSFIKKCKCFSTIICMILSIEFLLWFISDSMSTIIFLLVQSDLQSISEIRIQFKFSCTIMKLVACTSTTLLRKTITNSFFVRRYNLNR